MHRKDKIQREKIVISRDRSYYWHYDKGKLIAEGKIRPGGLIKPRTLDCETVYEEEIEKPRTEPGR